MQGEWGNDLITHPHPCRFRPSRWLDRGWGEAAFEYAWDSTSESKAENGENPDLLHCSLYEITSYDGNAGQYGDRWFSPPDPPFVGWQFRNPTDGRLQIVGGELIGATLGSAWDRHKLGGALKSPEVDERYEIRALQQYWCHCALCDADFPLSEPITILRVMEPVIEGDGSDRGCWRYLLTKHHKTVWMDWDARGYVDDSLHLGFAPFFGKDDPALCR